VNYRVVWERRAAKDARHLPPATLDRIRAEIRRFAATGHGDVKRLHGMRTTTYRLRSGDYRVIFDHPADSPDVLRILGIMSRQDDYRP
jgi:mRNA-degrading endonuclease RelE of RelBE toxin-antitoxin system